MLLSILYTLFNNSGVTKLGTIRPAVPAAEDSNVIKPLSISGPLTTEGFTLLGRSTTLKTPNTSAATSDGREYSIARINWTTIEENMILDN